MPKETRRHYPTLTPAQRQQLYKQIQNSRKSAFMLRRLLHKETRLMGKRMVANRIRALLYKRSLDPRGEPMYKRMAPWRCVIRPNDIAYLLRLSKRYSQDKFKALKKEYGKDWITVKEFCIAYKMDEEYVQRLLNDGDAREYNSPKWQRKIDALNKRYEADLKKIKEDMAKDEGKDDDWDDEEEEDRPIRKQQVIKKKAAPKNDVKKKKATKAKKPAGAYK